MAKFKNLIFTWMLLYLCACATSALSFQEASVVQLYKETSQCKKIGTVVEKDMMGGNYDVVVRWIKKSAYAAGANAFMVDYVSSSQRRDTTAFIYKCSDFNN